MLTDDTIRVPQLINHDQQFEFTQNHSGIDPVILDRFDLSTPDFIEQMTSQIFSDGSGNDFIAKCSCGHLEGNNKTGMTCPICHTVVMVNNLLDDNNLVCRNWLSAPKDLTSGWITPKLYLILSNWLSYGKGKSNYLDDIIDIDAPTPFDIADTIKGKGFMFLHENFDRIIEYFAYNHPVISKKADTPAILRCISLHRDGLFCHYVPILNAAIAPIISADNGGSKRNKYSEATADYVIQAAISLSALAFGPRRRDHMFNVERTAYKAFKNIITYFEESTKKYVSTKKAIPRMHVFGCRFHWSFRGVVVPICGPHDAHELHIPWKIAVNSLRDHLIGLLCRFYDLSPNDAHVKVRAALQSYDPIIDELFRKMISDSPFPGLPCVWCRPPAIRDGSVMLKFWTVIKTDLEDSSIGISPIDVALPNADKKI